MRGHVACICPQIKNTRLRRFRILICMVRPAGIEPARLAPEASALSSELRALPEHYIIPDSDGQNIRYPASLSRLSG